MAARCGAARPAVYLICGACTRLGEGERGVGALGLATRGHACHARPDVTPARLGNGYQQPTHMAASSVPNATQHLCIHSGSARGSGAASHAALAAEHDARPPATHPPGPQVRRARGPLPEYRCHCWAQPWRSRKGHGPAARGGLHMGGQAEQASAWPWQQEGCPLLHTDLWLGPIAAGCHVGVAQLGHAWSRRGKQQKPSRVAHRSALARAEQRPSSACRCQEPLGRAPRLPCERLGASRGPHARAEQDTAQAVAGVNSHIQRSSAPGLKSGMGAWPSCGSSTVPLSAGAPTDRPRALPAPASAARRRGLSCIPSGPGYLANW
jgi:hypothetical protein